MDDALNWDDAKAAENSRRHGLSFQQGAKALHNSFAVEWIDDREHYGEERVNLLVLRMIQISQLTPPSSLSRRRPGSTSAVGTGFRR
jgi:hypothetical protein